MRSDKSLLLFVRASVYVCVFERVKERVIVFVVIVQAGK